jgi:hypothetical protein
MPSLFMSSGGAEAATWPMMVWAFSDSCSLPREAGWRLRG